MPVPVPDDTSGPFWAACAAHELKLSRCTNCGWFAYPPRAVCLQCLITPPAFGWDPVSGRGTVRTWTVVRQAFLPDFAAEVPYVVADVELVEQPGLRFLARLRGTAPSEPAIGLPVQVAFDEMGGGIAIPYFVPAAM